MSLQPSRILLNRDEIKNAVETMGKELARDYRDRHPLLVGVLKGSFVFMADLVRTIDIPLEIEFIRLSSYGGRETPGRVSTVQGLITPVAGRDVLVVEDIVDTGLTINYLLGRLRQKRPSSLKLCALLDKPSRRKVPVSIDYLGFTVPDEFVVGYGLDCDERFRNLPDIYALV